MENHSFIETRKTINNKRQTSHGQWLYTGSTHPPAALFLPLSLQYHGWYQESFIIPGASARTFFTNSSSFPSSWSFWTSSFPPRCSELKKICHHMCEQEGGEGEISCLLALVLGPNNPSRKGASTNPQQAVSGMYERRQHRHPPLNHRESTSPHSKQRRHERPPTTLNAVCDILQIQVSDTL